MFLKKKLLVWKKLLLKFYEVRSERGVSIDSDSGPPRYVLWCCGGICHQVLTFFQIGCGHTVWEIWKFNESKILVCTSMTVFKFPSLLFLKSYYGNNTDYGHTKAKSLILCSPAQIQISIPYEYLECGYKGLFFCRNNGWIMEIMDKGTHCTKKGLIVQPKIPEMPQNLSVQFVCQPRKFSILMKKGFTGRP